MAIDNGPFIVDLPNLPIKAGDFPVRYVNAYQRVNPNHFPTQLTITFLSQLKMVISQLPSGNLTVCY
jgi:hypothetical protein